MKKITLLLSVIFVLSFVLLQVSCNDDTPSPINCNVTGQFSVEIDSVLFTATSFQNTLIFATDPSTGIETRRCDIRASDNNGNTVIITFNNPNQTDDSCMETGDYVAFTNVSNSNENVVLFTYNSQIISDGTFNLQSCDPNDDKKMVGTFTFDGTDFNTGDDILGRNGQFSICIP
ncbi:MAG: hypothetical protein AB8G11_12970 [Saprospiraceae bacterium]